MKVGEMMNKTIESVPAETSVNEVMKLMTKKMIRSVLIKPRNDSDSFGIVAVRDIFNKVLAKDIDPMNISVADIATKPVICVKTDMDVAQLMNMMQNYNIARVFVTDGTAIVGVVALMDFMRAAVK
ncbi:MAG TPA: CBS domain-containing protein [Nitrospirota bacterium]|nr:CBS domain-containing protein [Nitrospirota bacterium]